MKTALVLLLLGGCNFGDAFIFEDFYEPEIIIFNPTRLVIGKTPPIEWPAAWKNGRTLIANKSFGLRLNFDKYADYFYPNGEGRDSNYGHYQVVWKISREDTNENLLIIGSDKNYVNENKFVLLDALQSLDLSKSATMSDKAVIFLKIITLSPPFLPTGKYVIEAEINDGEVGDPKTLTTLSRTIFYQEPPAFYDNQSLIFRSHTANDNYVLKKAVVDEELLMQEQELKGSLKELVPLTHSYLIVEGFEKKSQPNETVLFSLDPTNTVTAKIVELSEAENPNAKAESSGQFYRADSFVLQIRITAAAQVLLLQIKLEDEYAQETASIPLNLTIS